LRYRTDSLWNRVDPPAFPEVLPAWVRRYTPLLALSVATLALALATQAATAVAAECSNESFRTGPGANVPDCRAYEQASPVDKNGAPVGGLVGLLLTSEDGSRSTFFSDAGTGVPAAGGSTQDYSTYLATRGAEGWSTQRLSAPQQLGEKADFLGATPDLRFAVVEAEQLGYEAPGFGRGLYLINTESQSIETLVARERNELEVPYAFDGASSDGSRVFFETTAALTPDARESASNLYVWERATNQVTLVGLLPSSEGGEAPELGAFGGAYEWYEEQNPYEGGALKGLAVGALHAISPTGDQIYFTAAGETAQLYLRRSIGTDEPTTVRVSAPATNAPAGEPTLPAAFQEATPDGSTAFFLSSQKLTENATTGPADEGKDLYRWDAGSGTLVDLTPDNVDPAGAEVLGLLGASADGTSGYFAARGVLAVGGQAGEENIYRFHEQGGEVQISYVATLLPEGSAPEAKYDRLNWSPRGHRYEANLATESASKSSRVSADGDTLLLSSTARLTGYDNESTHCTFSPASSATAPCSQLFRYSAVTGDLICVSCSPDGETALGSAVLESEAVSTGFTPEGHVSVSFSRNLSASGTRVFFEAAGPITPATAANTPACQAVNFGSNRFECPIVYEWEAPGEGSCVESDPAYFANSGGCLFVLGGAEADSGSSFVGASADGSDAFIISASQLVPLDLGQTNDLYDVKVGGGFASQNPVSEAPCSGEACQGPAAGAPPEGSPASSTVRGPGNPTSPKKPIRTHRRHKKHRGHKHHEHHKQTHRGKKSKQPPNRSSRHEGKSATKQGGVK
jgi:hypothetical protein